MAAGSTNVSSHKLNEIPSNFQTGTFALRWSDDLKKNPTPIVVDLSIDAKGFYLICVDKGKKEIKCFDLALIHDTRTGTQVTLPESIEFCEQTKIGTLDVPIASKWLTIYYGNTFVPSSGLDLIHFLFETPNIARDWAEQLFRFAHNPILRNLSCFEYLEKIYTKIIHGIIDLDTKKISVQKLIQFLCKNTPDFLKNTMVRRALEALQLPCANDSSISLEQFTFKKFFRLYMQLMKRTEIDDLLNKLDGTHRRHLSKDNLKIFLKKQNDGYCDPFDTDYYEQKAKDLIRKHTESDINDNDKGMSISSFVRYLLSNDSLIIDPVKYDLFMDMNKPLAHYFISSSHNTYLAGNQLIGRTSIEMYRQVLLTGCRCIELDVLDSEKKPDEPEIKHKNTPIKPALFIEVIVAIKEYAFKVTPYPLLLSFENHCGPKAQAKMAQYLVDVFGTNLLTEPLKTHPCVENQPLPSPNDLKYKILIKNKVIHSENDSKPKQNNIQKSISTPGENINRRSTDIPVDPSPCTMTKTPGSVEKLKKKFVQTKDNLVKQKSSSEINKESANFSDGTDEISSDDGMKNKINQMTITSTASDELRESNATKAMSHLVHYLVAVRFVTFAHAKQRNLSFQISSFTEDKGQTLIRDSAKEFLSYNQRQLSRIYPRGTRVESSNFYPYLFWQIGCQMVALNYQTLDVPMQLNLAFFSFNNNCGYIEKPSTLCQSQSSFDPRTQKIFENVVSYDIDIKILSGQFLCQDREPKTVEVQIYGVYGTSIKRQVYRATAKEWNGFQAIYEDLNSIDFTIQFPRIILPEMAAIRFLVLDEGGEFVGQCFIPVAYLCPGYRHILLRNQINIPVQSSSLFIFIRRNVYLNAQDQEFADKLVQPLMTNNINPNKSKDHLDNQGIFTDPHCPHLPIRKHGPLEGNQPSETPSCIDSCQSHAIQGSLFQDKKNLCKLSSLNDIDQTQTNKRAKNVYEKLRRVSIANQTKIQKEEDRLKSCKVDLSSLQSYPPAQLNRSQTKYDLPNSIKRQDIQRNLLQLYSDKLNQQQEIEIKMLYDYYDELKRNLSKEYNNRLIEFEKILKAETNRVRKNCQSLMKLDIEGFEKNEKDKNKILMFKEKHSQICNITIETTITELEDMYEGARETLSVNLEKIFREIEEKQNLETEHCLEQYSNRYNDIQCRLQFQPKLDEYDAVFENSLHRPRSTTKP